MVLGYHVKPVPFPYTVPWPVFYFLSFVLNVSIYSAALKWFFVNRLSFLCLGFGGGSVCGCTQTGVGKSLKMMMMIIIIIIIIIIIMTKWFKYFKICNIIKYLGHVRSFVYNCSIMQCFIWRHWNCVCRQWQWCCCNKGALCLWCHLLFSCGSGRAIRKFLVDGSENIIKISCFVG